MSLLVLGGPLAKADDEHPERLALRPGTMPVAWPNQELLMGFWPDDIAIDLKERRRSGALAGWRSRAFLIAARMAVTTPHTMTATETAKNPGLWPMVHQW